MKLLFSNALLLMPDGKIERGCLGVSDNIIEFVGEMPNGFEAERIIDCEQNLLMPGFVNAHTHLPMTLFRSIADDVELNSWLFEHIFPMEEKLNDERAYWGTQLAMLEMLRCGVTCVNDMYFFSNAVAESIDQSGMRALIGRGISSDDKGGGALRLKEAVDLYKRWNGAANDRIRVSMAPHAEYTCSDEDLKAVAETAKELNCRIHVHVSESFSEHEQCKDKHGITPLFRLDKAGLIGPQTMLAHCVHVELEDIALIAAKKSHILHCPQSNCKLGSGIAPLSVFMAQKINIALGTDGAASNNNLDLLEEVRLCSLIHKGFTNNATMVNALQSLSMGTRGGALALGFNSGILQSGALADIIMIDTKAPHMLPQNNLVAHLAYSAHSSDVLLTMVDGKVLYERGEYYTLDPELISLNAQRCAEDMLEA